MTQNAFSKKLQTIIDYSNIKGVHVANYDTTLPDRMDECGANGLWDLACDIAFILCPIGYTDVNGRDLEPQEEQLHTLLYELMRLLLETKEDTND